MRWLLWMATCACGRVGFDATAPNDAACTLGAWSATRIVDELSIPGTTLGAQVSPDGLEIYFGHDGATTQGLDIFYASRATRDVPFARPALITELSSPAYDHNPTITADGRELWLASSRGGQQCLYRSLRSSRSAPWPAPQVVAQFCLPNIAYDGPYLSGDGLTLVYTDDPGTGRRTFVTTRDVRTADFSNARQLTELTVGTGRGYAVLGPDLHTIYFEAYETPELVSLWQATRASLAAPFGDAERIPIDRVGEDVSITDDGRELYFASVPLGGSSPTLYAATRDCE